MCVGSKWPLQLGECFHFHRSFAYLFLSNRCVTFSVRKPPKVECLRERRCEIATVE